MYTPRERISKITSALLLLVAVFYDSIALILGLFGIPGNTILGFFVPFHFWLWFAIKDVPFVKGNDLWKKALVWIAEVIPYVGALLPGYTIQIYFTVKKAQKEDREYNEKMRLEFENKWLEEEQQRYRDQQELYEEMVGGQDEKEEN